MGRTARDRLAGNGDAVVVELAAVTLGDDCGDHGSIPPAVASAGKPPR
jgi:hypothetical protein